MSRTGSSASVFETRGRRGALAATVSLMAVVVAVALPAAPAVAADCPNAAIRAQQGVEYLPDCMALEKVSVDDKASQLANTVDGAAVRTGFSEDGNRVTYLARAALAGAPSYINVYGEAYLAERGADGWVTHATSPPVDNVVSGGLPLIVDDLTRWLTFASPGALRDAGRFFVAEDGIGLDGPPVAWTDPFTPTDGAHFKRNTAALFTGMTSDGSHVYFVAGDTSTALIAGDPSPTGPGADSNAYVLTKPAGQPAALALVARDSAGTAWGGTCGASLGGGRRFEAPSAKSGRFQGAVSGNGSQVLFSTRPAQPQTGECDTSLPRRIMRRVESGDTVTIDELLPSLPATGSDFFEGASTDGSKVFFTTTRALAAGDTDSSATDCSESTAVTGCDLYLYDSDPPVGAPSLVQVSRGVDGAPTPGDGAAVTKYITAVSTDGSHVYFVADGVLTTAANAAGGQPQAGQPNLYVYQRDEDFPAGRLAFIGTLNASTDHSLSPDGTYGAENPQSEGPMALPTGSPRDEAGGDGHVLVFMSGAALLPGDDDGGRVDAYRYDSTTGELLRVSTAPAGGSDDGPFDIYQVSYDRMQDAGQGRWASDDADTVAFTVSDALSGAGDDSRSVYLWRKEGADTNLVRLPSATYDESQRPHSAAVSLDGSQVAFSTNDRLLPQDGDAVSDIYLARVGGGFPMPAPSPLCELVEACQGGGAAATAPVLGGVDGSGNPVAQSRGRISLSRVSAGARRKLAAGRSARVRVRVSTPGLVTVRGVARLDGGNREVFRVRREVKRAGPVTLRLRLSRPARRALARDGRLTVRLVVEFSRSNKAVTQRVRLHRSAVHASAGRAGA